MEHFKSYMKGKTMKSAESKEIEGTLSLLIVTLDNDEKLVVADRAMVSYDKGFYAILERSNEFHAAFLEEVHTLPRK